jgi:hypothetical protein
MIFSLFTVPQLLYIILVPMVVLGGLFCLIFFPIRKRVIRKKYVEHYYREIYKIAQQNDYYLINDFVFKIDDASLLTIDHVLFANKYVYLISDFYYDGDIVGKAGDKSLVCLSKKDKKHYIDNPMLFNKHVLNRLCMMTNLDPSIMIGVSLVNDDIRVEIDSDSKDFYLIQRNKLASLVKAIESRPISNLNAQSLENLVQSINKMNKRKKNNVNN